MKTPYIFIPLLAFLAISPSARSQSQLGFVYKPDVKVLIGTEELEHPWAGGLNNVQFSDIDIDYDGDMDLLVFDRSGDEISLFTTEIVDGAPVYVYRYGGHELFPADVRYRAATFDYNNDGKKDLFTYAIGGLKVYKNVGSSSTGVLWQEASPLVKSDYGDNLTNLYVSSSDIPALVDVDADGDMDVLTFNIGGEVMEYHQNQSIELYGVPDSLEFILKNQCWGLFREDINTNGVELNVQDSPCGTGNVPNPQRPAANISSGDTEHDEPVPGLPTRHAGSTVLALDMNANGVLDLVLGDVTYPTLTYLRNGGTAPNTNSAMVEQQPNFPQNTTAANMQLFPASFYVDVNHDGVKDLIVGANAKAISQNQKSVLYYENTGANNLPVFNFRSKAFLQGDMIDNGFGSIPVLFDQNGDGKRDLLIANFYRYKEVLDKEPALLIYRNTGTATAPEYTYLNDNFLGIASQVGQLRPVPTFADLDDDGDEDMIVGLGNGELRLFTNTSGPGNPVAFSAPLVLADNNGITISAQSFAAPQLFDLNNDGKKDLIIGKKTGELIYYENTGTASSAQFTLKNPKLGNVDVNELTPDGYAVPHFFRADGSLHLFVGAYDGKLHYYNGIEDKLDPDSSFHLVSPAFRGIDVGLYSSFWVEDIDNDGLLNMFVGQDLGGLHLMETDPNSTAGLESKSAREVSWILVPNPAEQSFSVLNLASPEKPAQVEIFTLSGQQVLSGTNSQAIDISAFGKGVYIVRVTGGNTTEIHRLVKQ